jgi:hypothetical protein
MSPIEKHIQISIERTGKDYRDIHEWIDHPEKNLSATILAEFWN